MKGALFAAAMLYTLTILCLAVLGTGWISAQVVLNPIYLWDNLWLYLVISVVAGLLLGAYAMKLVQDDTSQSVTVSPLQAGAVIAGLISVTTYLAVSSGIPALRTYVGAEEHVLVFTVAEGSQTRRGERRCPNAVFVEELPILLNKICNAGYFPPGSQIELRGPGSPAGIRL